MYSFGTLRVVLTVTLPIVSATISLVDVCSDAVCSHSGPSLLQVQTVAVMPTKISGSGHTNHGVKHGEPITGKTADLTESGYKAVVALCCAEEMMEFTRRMIEGDGFYVCDEGGLTGFSPWYDCADDGQTFDAFKEALIQARSGDCPFVSASTDCPSWAPTCPKAMPCKHVVCCAMPASLLEQGHLRRTKTSKSKLASWDCVSHSGPIQVLLEGSGYSVSNLDISTGEYTQIWAIQPTMTTPAFTLDELNSVGINPIDSIMYASIEIESLPYLVRVAESGLEFVARLPSPTQYWANNVNDAGYNAATFSPSGTYYIATKPNSNLIVIKNLASMPGFASRDSPGLPQWNERDYPGVYLNSNTADIVANPGSYDGGVETEYVFLMGIDAKLIVVKTAETVDAFTVWTLTTSGGAPPGYGFGAGWNFLGRLFFADNGGSGVYEIEKNTINLSDGTVSLKIVGASKATSMNDGANCLDAPSPWSGECDAPYVDVAPVDGTCPAGSVQH